MAWVSRISIMLCALLSTTLPLTSMAHASKQARESSATTHITKKVDKKKSTATTRKTQKVAKKAVSRSTTKSKTASSVKKSPITASKNAKTRNKHAVNKMASTGSIEKYTECKGYKSHCVRVKNAALGILADAHRAGVRKVMKVAMNKLMQQIGKPCRRGGSSPRTGFDYSGLVYYAYKDLAEIRIPHTANEMCHLRDAVPIERSELKNGDLVFFRTQGRGTVDHIGVYVGNGKFIQSPRIGQEIQTTSLSEDYRQCHHVGIRQVMTPKTLC